MVRARQAQGLEHFVVGAAGPRPLQIAAYRVIEQEGVLGHIGQLRATPLERRAGKLAAEGQDPSRLGDQQAGGQVQEGGLAGAGGPGDPDEGARGDRQADLAQSGRTIESSRMPESDISERQRFAGGCGRRQYGRRPLDGI